MKTTAEQLVEKERPILMKPEMVIATLSGIKTQTRRVIKKVNGELFEPRKNVKINLDNELGKTLAETSFCPYGVTGNQLWVKETFYKYTGCQPKLAREFRYFADNPVDESNLSEYSMWLKKSSMFMPRVASRINLLIKDIRIERLRDIKKAGAIAEGFNSVKEFANYICLINGNEIWSLNPYVWVIEFEKIN